MLTPTLHRQFEEELEHIVSYWKTYAVDEENGGFVGRKDHYNQWVPDVPKGIILNTRMLWTFSAVSRLLFCTLKLQDSQTQHPLSPILTEFRYL